MDGLGYLGHVIGFWTLGMEDDEHFPVVDAYLIRPVAVSHSRFRGSADWADGCMYSF